MDQRWGTRVEELFAQAVERPPDERRAFLDASCAGDMRLLREVESLLQVDDDEASSGFMSTPVRVECAQGAGDLLVRDECVGSLMAGRYKILRPLGEGGMGIVYLAEQISPLRRRVAIKVLKLGMDTRQVVARFEAERQALAMMDHPSIARALDAGATESGRPFFAMELVRGLALTRYCDEQRLSVRERIELFLPVCEAIQHAHHKGVIHRDLKPGNIIVTLDSGSAVGKVIDFGVAKATNQSLTEKTLFTEHG